VRGIRIELARPFARATAVSGNTDLPVTNIGRHGAFTVPILKAYEVVIIE
jgi:hypothetical protein